MTTQEKRQAVIRTAVHEMIDHGFSLSVDRGGDDYELDRTRDADQALAAMGSGNARLVVIDGRYPAGWICFDASTYHMTDYTIGLEPYTQETRALIETYDEVDA